MVKCRYLPVTGLFWVLGILNCVAQEKPGDWTHLLSNGPVNVYYKYVLCDPEIGYDNESVLLKLANTSKQSVIAEWDNEIYFDGICATCDLGEEGHLVYELGPEVVFEGSCSINGDGRLKLFSRFTDKQYKLKQQTMTGFKLNSFRVRLANPLE